MSAAEFGDATCVGLLLHAGVDTALVSENGATALIVAAEFGDAQCVELMLNVGADKDAKDHQGWTALMVAADTGRTAFVDLLLTAGADSEAKNLYHNSALSMAAFQGHADCIALLLNATKSVTLNSIPDVSMLVEALKENTTVTHVNLSHDAIGDEGAIALAAALKENATIRELHLSFNVIGDEGAVALARALTTHTSLTTILLHHCSIGNIGASAFLETLRCNTVLTSVSLRGNPIVPSAADIADRKRRDAADAVGGVMTIRGGVHDNVVASEVKSINDCCFRNHRFRRLFLFDARQQLTALMCADEVSVLWPYYIESGVTDGMAAPSGEDWPGGHMEGVAAGGDYIEAIRAQFVEVAEARRAYDAAAAPRDVDDDVVAHIDDAVDAGAESDGIAGRMAKRRRRQ
jgi:hypothetical protein